MDLQDKILKEAIDRISSNLEAVAKELYSSREFSKEKGWKNVSIKPERADICYLTLLTSMGQLKAIIPFLNVRLKITSETLKDFIK